MNIYTYSFVSKCPNDDHGFIYYTVEIETKLMIMVEDIIKHCSDHYKEAYHETIADDLIGKFGGVQTITATHQGVKIRTVRHENNA